MNFIDMHEEQQNAFILSLRHLVNQETNSQYMVMDSPGGSGKTTIIKSMMSFLSKTPAFTGIVTAFTGRACSQLRKAGISAHTCHTVLFKPVLDKDGNLIKFEDRPVDEIRSFVGKFIIVDEASMVTKEMHDSLSSVGVKILYVGDSSQLPPVDRSNPDFNVMKSLDCYNIVLEENHRHKKDSGIQKLASHLRDNNTIPRMKKSDLRMVPKSSCVSLSFFQKNKDNFDIVLCGMNKTRKKINSLIRASYGYGGDLPEVGEKIVCLQNTVIGEHKISNGELFRVDGVFEDSEISKFYVTSLDSGKSYTVNVENHCWETETPTMRMKGNMPICAFGFGYCMSVHKSQGSQWKNILFIDEDVSFFLDQQRFRYTAVSRASENLTVAI